MTTIQNKQTSPVAHLTPEDIENLGRELDAIREQVITSRGERDAAYIRRVIDVQRALEVGGRGVLLFSLFPPAWLLGTTSLSIAKILENMEIGHNVMHGQWDWMRDEEIHSTTWEWDNVCPSVQWKHTHNHMHHQWTNVAKVDRDIGYGVIRIDPNQPWTKSMIGQPIYFVLLALLFEWGVGFHDLEADLASGEQVTLGTIMPKLRQNLRKIARQVTKDYVAFPALAAPLGLPSVVAVATGNAAANVVRNIWSFAVIFCGHFPDDVEIFTEADIEHETRGGWCRRQVLGSANFEGGALMDLMSGNLNHQIEHHLFPDLPSNRYSEIAPAVQEICARHGVAYNERSFAAQFGSVVRKVFRLALPGSGPRRP